MRLLEDVETVLMEVVALSLSLSLSTPCFLREVMPVLAQESTRVKYSGKWGLKQLHQLKRDADDQRKEVLLQVEKNIL